MADFCNQCADDLGLPRGDMSGITTGADWTAGRAAIVLCEDCGPIQVDPQGNCVSPDCGKHHGRKAEAER